MSRAALDLAAARFADAWPDARVAFSPYTRLAAPILCRTKADERREGLEGSFAMIRMRDQRIVISLAQVVELALAEHAHAILAHEVGHYVHAPGTLREHVLLHDRIRRTLPAELASHAGLVANLYTDLLLNDRLQRSRTADIAAVYVALRRPEASELWTVYMRAYERLWALAAGTLTDAGDVAIEADAELIARIVRSFRDRWLEGAPSFALLIAPYLERLPTDRLGLAPWMDTAATSVGELIPDGLIDDDFDPADVKHPAIDPALGDDADDGGADEPAPPQRFPPGRSAGSDGRPDRRKVARGPEAWLDLMRAVGVRRTPRELVGRYYRELAMPHVPPFPAQRLARAGDPLPEGLDPWEAGGALEAIDWFETLARSPVVVPGVTTVQRAFGVTEGGEPERRVPDLYVGIDCSGSMGNPAKQLAYPVVAGVVLTLSALRAGARVMACLSGEWHGQGNFTETAGFVRDEGAVLGVLTDYLGTGCSFGLPRLIKTFVEAPAPTRPVHVLVVSDSDLFGEIDGTADGWALAARAVERAGGGASAVLRLANAPYYEPHLARLRDAGFTPYLVASEPELVAFARAFARRTFGRP
ncbi:MAG: VWA domain-containing protein [Myxococcales bacterium]|nr:VWA domain-containing protein [Myxococcales bacterium]